MRRVFYADESGTGKGPCNCLVIGGVLIEVSGSYVYGGVELLQSIKKRFDVKGEVKWRLLKRRGLGEAVFREVSSRFPVEYVKIHVGEGDVERAFLALLRRVKADLYVVDKGLIDTRLFSGVVERPSHKVPGIQLADIVAGHFADQLCRPQRFAPDL